MYVFATGLYLERFDDEALLLVAERQPSADCQCCGRRTFYRRSGCFGSCPFSLEQGIDWLAGDYDLDAQAMPCQGRELLAFALRNGLVCQTNDER